VGAERRKRTRAEKIGRRIGQGVNGNSEYTSGQGARTGTDLTMKKKGDKKFTTKRSRVIH